MPRIFIACLASCFFIAAARSETVVDFEELNFFNGTPPSNQGQYFNGYGAGASNTGFVSRGVTFETNQFGPGWSYSNADDATSPGFLNQFAAFPRGGSAGDGSAVIGSNYAMVNTGGATLPDGTPQNGATLNFDRSADLLSVDIANATYSLIFMRDGVDTNFAGDPQFDPDAKFTDGDFLRLSITGFDGVDGQGNVTGTVDYDLANFGGAGEADDVLLTEWDTISLKGFASTRSLKFATTSSQISVFSFGAFHDVPAYAAVDNLTFVTAIPEPSAALVLAVAGGFVVCRRRRR